jgi:hypothetical protein
MLLGLCLIAVPIEVRAGERVIYSFEQLTENSGRVTLSFYDSKNTDNIQITGYSVINKNQVKVSYVTGINATRNDNTIKIINPIIEFPLKIFLEEGQNTRIKITDLPKDTALRDHILHLYDRGVINGYPDGSFKPNNNITRQEVTTLITLAANYAYDENAVTTFSDVPTKYWATKFIVTLSKKGILVGTGSNKFEPKKNITIGEIITIIDKTFDINLDAKQAFEVPVKSHWSNTFYTSLMQKGLILRADAYVMPYNPTKLATRGEVATLISRALENLHIIR